MSKVSVGSMMDAERMATGGSMKMPMYGTYGGAGLQMVTGQMLPASPFVKAPQSYDPCYRPPGQMRTMQYTAQDRACAEKRRAEQERNRPYMPRVMEPTKPGMAGVLERLRSLPRPEPTNTAVRPSIGHPKFGFGVNLPQVIAPLPTAPAVVGGNVDWNSLKSGPATQFLHSQMSLGRPMMPPTALGSLVRLGEPSLNSIHTTY